MQVLCNPSDTVCDIRCPLCAQGFCVYWERSSREEQDQTRRVIEQELCDHHAQVSTPEAHPQTAFNIPSWSGHPHFSGAALLGGLPDKTA